MSNCSTHLFLGTNAQKTLETFSKQLGEKTITRDSVSRSTDKDSKFSGRNYSDQAMGRALMTPDELRKMSPDECIILVQAMKPIKATKYWYYKKPGPHPRAAEAKETELNHRDIAEPKRGEYRVTNPYELTNYDDIFAKYANNHEDIEIDSLNTDKNNNGNLVENNNSNSYSNSNEKLISENKNEAKEEYDLYAELDKKFMELYGSKKS